MEKINKINKGRNEKLNDSIIKNIKDISLSEPEDGYVPKIRGRFRKQIIIKYTKEIPPKLRKILNGLGQGWIIDVDPISIT